MTIGIVGAGKLGMTLARIARYYGLRVLISGSGDPRSIKLTVDVLAPGAEALSTSELAEQSDFIILALPLGKFRTIPADQFDDKLVIDAMNYWWEVDGPRENIVPGNLSSSEAVQRYFAGARVVKALSHMGYHDLFDGHKPKGQPKRKAIAIAGDNAADVQEVSKLVDRLGFDPVPIGALENGKKLEPGSSLFGANLTAENLTRQIDQ